MLDDLFVAEAVVELLEEAGHEARVYENYSGRGMYNTTCIGIVTDAPPILVGYYFGRAHIDSNYDEEDLPLRADNLGLSKIYY